MMKFRLLAVVTLLLPAMSVASAADPNWKGWITDSRCGASGAHPGDAVCAKSCVKRGAKFVLVDDSNKKVYTLEPQEKVAAHASEHVQVEGTLEGHTLKFISIQPIQ
jgi:hypothetical protein